MARWELKSGESSDVDMDESGAGVLETLRAERETRRP
jgi:hypothetical protein